MLRTSFKLLLLLVFGFAAVFAYAQDDEAQFAAPFVAAKNEAAGIKLPAPYVIKASEQWTDITAECKGPVSWLVLSTTEKVKYKKRTPNTITVGIPNKTCVITIYAIGLVDAKQTSFVRTDISVDDGTAPRPPPGPGPSPGPVKGTVHITIIEDAAQRAPELAAILDSPTIGQKLPTPDFQLHLLSAQSPVTKAKGFDKKIEEAVKQYGPKPAWVVLQNVNGQVLLTAPVPKTEDELVKLVKDRVR